MGIHVGLGMGSCRSHVSPMLEALEHQHKCCLTRMVQVGMGGCQNYGPFLGTLNIMCRIIIGIQKGTIILTTTRIFLRLKYVPYSYMGPLIEFGPRLMLASRHDEFPRV